MMEERAYYYSQFVPFTTYHQHIFAILREQFSTVTLIQVGDELPLTVMNSYFTTVAETFQLSFDYEIVSEAALAEIDYASCFQDALTPERTNFQVLKGTHDVPKSFKEHFVFDGIPLPIAETIFRLGVIEIPREVHLVFAAMNYERFQHTMRTCYLIKELAKIHRLDMKACYYAALFHDYAKDMPLDEQAYFMQTSFQMYEDAPRAVWHGFVGALLVSQLFDALDDRIVEAISFHSIGLPEMDEIGIALFVADFCDYERPHDAKVAHVWEQAQTSLYDAAKQKIIYSREYLNQKGEKLYWVTENMLNWLDTRERTDILE